MKKKLIIILLIIFLIFSLVLSTIRNNKKYLIINNDRIFEVKNNKFIEVNEYPAEINNEKVAYFDNLGRHEGYINFRETKKSGYTQDDFNNKVNLYTLDYKKIKSSSSLIAIYNLENFKYINLDDISVLSVINSEDINVITSYLKEKSMDYTNDLTYSYVYNLDIDNDQISEKIYLISNFFSKNIQNDVVTGLDKNPLLFEYVFIYDDNKFITLFENNYQDSGNLKYIMLNNIFDIEGDGQLEFAFMSKNFLDYNENCEVIYKSINNKYEKYSDCKEGNE